MTNTILFILLIASQLTFANQRKRVWIDYDIAFGMAFKDPDDGLALIHALLSQDQLNIIGISGGYGNTNKVHKMRRITKKILKRTNSLSIPYFQGALIHHKRRVKTKAYYALVKALEKAPLTIIAMGRMTNVATVVDHRPDLIKNMKEVIINAGRRLEYPTVFGRKKIVFSDSNIDGDVKSIKFLAEKNVPLTMIPVESMTTMQWRKRELRHMKKAGHITRWMAKKARFWRWIFTLYSKEPGFLPWDIFTVSYLTHPEDFLCDKNIPYQVKRLRNDTTKFLNRPHPEFKDFLVASYKLDTPSTGHYCYKILDQHREKLIEYWINKQARLAL